MASSSSPNENHDYLTSLPPEILVKVISELSISNYLDIAHTSRQLRSVLMTHAAMICTHRIRMHYRFPAKFLESDVVSGWLVPTHHAIAREEDFYDSWVLDRCREFNKMKENNDKDHNHEDFKHFSLLGQIFPSEKAKGHLIDIKISTAGPQYLYFLESALMDICDGVEVKDKKEGTEEGEDNGVRSQCECAFHYKGHKDCFCIFGQEDGFGKFYDFMTGFNDQVIELKGGELMANSMKERFPRAMVWYYGVDNLVLSEEAVEEVAAGKFEEGVEEASAQDL